MFDLLNNVFKFLFRIFIVLAKLFRKIFVDKPVEQRKIVALDYAKQQSLRCENELKKHLFGLSESHQQRIREILLPFPSVSHCRLDACIPKKLEDYHNDILTLKGSLIESAT